MATKLVLDSKVDAIEAPARLGRVSKRAWQEWMALQTRLINEKQLRMSDAPARKFLTEQRTKFFSNAADVEEAEGYVPKPPA